jgi:hypothetical protein
LKDAFKRAFQAFLEATREGINDNLREQEELAADIQAKRLSQQAARQKPATE